MAGTTSTRTSTSCDRHLLPLAKQRMRIIEHNQTLAVLEQSPQCLRIWTANEHDRSNDSLSSSNQQLVLNVQIVSYRSVDDAAEDTDAVALGAALAEARRGMGLGDTRLASDRGCASP